MASVIVLILVISLLAVDGTENSSENTLRMVLASEILAKIQMGEPVEYDHVIVKGDLDLSGLCLPVKHINRTIFEIEFIDLTETLNVIASPIKISDSVFDGFVSFGNAVFTEINFHGSNFTKNADFKGVTFSGEFDLGSATFTKDADFRRATFSGNDLFQEAMADFSKAIFRGYADFNGAIFSENAGFECATFSEDADFSNAIFNKIAVFKGATFGRDAAFIGATFSRDANFQEAAFSGDTNFRKAMFNAKTNFIGSRFSKYFFGWTDVKNKFYCDEAAYLSLIKNFKDNGQFNDADDCYYQYRFTKMFSNIQYDVPGFISDVLSLIIFGYGVKLMMTFFLALFIIFIFGLWFSKDMDGDLLKALSMSVITILSLPSDWLGSEKSQYSGFISEHIKSATLERLIGWSLLIILVNTLSRLMIRY